jgi:hypothetical protein
MSDEQMAADTAPDTNIDTNVGTDDPVVNDNPEPQGDSGDLETEYSFETHEPADPQPSQNQDVDIKAELAELRRRAEMAEERAKISQDLMTQNMTHQDRIAQEQAERERLMSMTPEERFEYFAQKKEEELDRKMKDYEARLHDANDRASYAALEASNPIAKKYKSEVEKRLQEGRGQGFNYSREFLLTYIAGEKALKAAAAGGGQRQKQQAQENVQRSQSSPTASSGDMSGEPTPRDSKEARNARLAQGKGSYR